MNSPIQGHQSSALSKTPRNRTVQAHVITLERVQQSLSASFTVSRLVQQEHPRFTHTAPDDADGNGKTPPQTGCYQPVEVEGMRGVLESCWDLSALHHQPSTTTTLVHANQPVRHQVQLQRLHRTLSGHSLTGQPTPRLQQLLAGAPQGKRSSNTTTSSSSRTAARSFDAALYAPAGVQDEQTHQLQVLFDLWHLYTTSEGFSQYKQDYTG